MPKRTTVLVDRMLEDSYGVVKTVYQNLDAIKSLNENENIQQLLDNYAEVKKVLDSTPALIEVAENLEDILSSSDNANRANAYAEQAVKTLDETKQQATVVASYLDQTKQAVQNIEASIDNVNTVVDNLDKLTDVTANLEDIKLLAKTFTDENSSEAIDELINNLSAVNAVADNLTYLKELASVVLDKTTLEKLNSALNQIKTVNDTCNQALGRLEEKLDMMQKQSDAFEVMSDNATKTFKDNADDAESTLRDIKQDCEELLTKVQEYNTTAETIQEDCNRILLKCRDIFHAIEDAFNKGLKKAMLEVLHEGDTQSHRIKHVGDTQADRLNQQMDSIIEATADGMQEKADEIAEAALQQIQDKADQALADLEAKITEAETNFTNTVNEIQTTLDEIKANADQALTDINASIEQAKTDFKTLTNDLIAKINEAADAKLKEIADYIVQTKYGDIIWGYVDYSLPENQEEMIVGVTYINAWDSQGYIQISKDSNDFERSPEFIRFYVKSCSGTVTYLEKKVKWDINDILAATTEVKGIVELATAKEVQEGTDYERVVTPGTLAESLPSLVQNVVAPKLDGTTNTVVEAILNTIDGDSTLRQQLIDSLSDLLVDLIINNTPEGRKATTEQSGIVELATIPETRAGTDAERAITPSGLWESLPTLLQAIFSANKDETTNNVVQTIIQTISKDTHLQEDLTAALTDKIYEELNLKDYAKLSGADFTGKITVPNQQEESSSAEWSDTAVLNKTDILQLLAENLPKTTFVQLLQSWPSEDSAIKEDIIYACPLSENDPNFGLGNGEITTINLEEGKIFDDASVNEVEEGEMTFFSAGDLL